MTLRTFPMTRVLPYALALLPLLAIAVAGAFASATIAVILLGGLWIAWRSRAFAVLACQIGGLGLIAAMAVTLEGKATESVLFAATALSAVVWLRLPSLLPDGDMRRARWVFVGAAIVLPVLLLVRAQLFLADLIPPMSVAPDMLAKPTFVAMTLVPAVLVIVWRGGLWPVALAFAGFMGVMAVGSASSTATLAYILAACAMVAALVRPILGLAASAAVLLLPLVASVAIQISGVESLSEIGLRASWLHRLDLWQRALVLFEQAPLFGHGFDTYANLMTEVDMGGLSIGFGRNHTHSVAMQLLAEGGIAALVVLGALLWLVGRSPDARRDRWRNAARLGALAAAVTPPAIGLNLWSDVTAMLIVYPLLAFSLFVLPCSNCPQALDHADSG